MYHLTPTLVEPTVVSHQTKPDIFARSSINTGSAILNSFIIIHQYRLLASKAAWDLLYIATCLCKHPFTLLEHSNSLLKISSSDLTYTTDFVCIFIPEVWCCLVSMNDGHYMLVSQHKFKHLKRPHYFFIPYVSSYLLLHT